MAAGVVQGQGAQLFPRAAELGVLSVLTHAGSERGFDVALAALHGALHVDEQQSLLYSRLILSGLPRELRSRLEREMRNRKLFEPSDLEKKILARGEAHGRAEGEARGEARGEANAILTVLSTRGVPVPQRARRRILACKDHEKLSAWLVRAVTAEKASELFAEGR
jgi:hypothetical protein